MSDPRKDLQAITLVEAALYVAGKPLSTRTLGSVIGTRSKRKVRKLARALSEHYSNSAGALEVVELSNDRFALQLKPQYVSRVKRLSIRPVLSEGTLKTLSYIALNQPVVQSRVAEARGSHVYKHIRELKRVGLIATAKLGKTQIIQTTDVFADYLKLSPNRRLMKRQLNAIFKPRRKQEKRAVAS